MHGLWYWRLRLNIETQCYHYHYHPNCNERVVLRVHAHVQFHYRMMQSWVCACAQCSTGIVHAPSDHVLSDRVLMLGLSKLCIHCLASHWYRFSIDSLLNHRTAAQTPLTLLYLTTRAFSGRDTTSLFLLASGGKLHFFVYFRRMLDQSYLTESPCSWARHHGTLALMCMRTLVAINFCGWKFSWLLNWPRNNEY